MPKPVTLTAPRAYEIADAFGQASSAILEYRVSNRSSLSKAEARALESAEDRLDSLVVLFRGYGIALLAADAQAAATELTQAITKARNALNTIENVKTAIRIAGAVADLAVAVLAVNPKGVADAAAEIGKLAKT